MKKKILALIGAAVLTLGAGSCSSNTPSVSSSSNSGSGTTIVQRYTVAFEVDGERYKTVAVKEGETIAESIAKPYKENHVFIGWMEGNQLVDLATYVVTKNTTFTAKFEVQEEEDVLNVEDVKEADALYTLVLGWWEVSDPEDPTKVTSGLTKDSVRLFYANLNRYLKITGSTDEEIGAVSFRNYSTATVSEMGNAVNSDGDVDLLIGVGANVFTTAGVAPYDASDNSKFSTAMGTAGKERYVALIKDAREKAVAVYDWLQSDIGKQSFLKELTDEEIQASLAPVTIDLSVTVHGDSAVTTVLESKEKAVDLPTITVPEGKQFSGFATEENGEVVLNVSLHATLKYDDLKSLVVEGENTLHLYPVFIDRPVEENDLVVSIQTHSGNLPTYEASLLAARFVSTLDDQTVKFNFIDADAATFTAAIENDPTVDVVIGGNNPIKNFETYAEGPLANAGGKHFVNTSRKVAVLSGVDSQHADLAMRFYRFVTEEAIPFEIHTTFWTKEYAWVSAEEVSTIKAGMESSVKTYLHVDETESLTDNYNVGLTYYEAVQTKVAELGEETKGLRDGKGTDLIVGCGNNVTSAGFVEVVDKKAISATLVAAGRYVALVNDNALTRDIYENYFADDVTEVVE